MVPSTPKQAIPTIIVNSTFTGNSTSESEGGAIFIYNTKTKIYSSTIAGNSSRDDGGGIYQYDPSGTSTLTLTNSIVGGNTAGYGADIYGSFTDGGGNLASNNTSGTSTINPLLAPLGNYGGPTQTMVPLPGSPAICAAALSGSLPGTTTDQRGYPLQPIGGYCASGTVDSGAVQSNYALAFTTQPPATVYVGATIAPAPMVTLTESGNLASLPTSTVTMKDSSNVLSGTPSAGLSSGTATFTGLVLPSAAINDIFTASLGLNSSLSITAQATQGVTTITPVPAVMQSPTPGATTILGTGIVKFQWSAGVGVTSYQVVVGTAGVGSDNLYASGRLSGTTFQVKKIPANGVTVFVKLGSIINGKWQFQYYVYMESGSPTLATLTVPGANMATTPPTLLPGQQLFAWNNGEGPLDFIFQLGTTGEGSNDLYSSHLTTATFAPVSIPLNGVTVYGTLSQRINGTWQVSH